MIKIGLLGLGTIGSSIVKLFNLSFDPKSVAITTILVNNINKKRCSDLNLTNIKLTTDPVDILNNPEIHLVIEVMGGEMPALEYILTALQNKKAVVTANKAVLALYGNKIFKTALDNKTPIAFEASVGGGIPIIRSLINSINCNTMKRFIGICNGTSNYILSNMFEKHLSFSEALEQAKSLGFAESDPSADIDGYDSAHKCSILAALAFKHDFTYSLNQDSFNKIYREGIVDISLLDLQHAHRLGYSIKPVVYGLKTNNNLQLATFPALVNKNNLISNINGVDNIIQLDSSILGISNYTGPGAGGDATASSILADVWNIINNQSLDLGFYAGFNNKYNFTNIDDAKFSYFITVSVSGKIACKNKLIADIIQIANNSKIHVKEPFFSDHDPDTVNACIVLLTDIIIDSHIQEFCAELLHQENIIDCKKIRVID